MRRPAQSSSSHCKYPPGSALRVKPKYQAIHTQITEAERTMHSLSNFARVFKIGTGSLFAISRKKIPIWTMSYFSTIAVGTSEKASQVKCDTFAGSHFSAGLCKASISYPCSVEDLGSCLDASSSQILIVCYGTSVGISWLTSST